LHNVEFFKLQSLNQKAELEIFVMNVLGFPPQDDSFAIKSVSWGL